MLLGLLGLFTIAAAQSEVPPRYQALDDALGQLEERGLLIGEVVAAADDTIVYRRRFGGVADDARYRLGSISKSLTAAVVMSLVDEGRISLDDAVTRHIPEVTLEWKGEPVRLSHLMHHTSGLTGEGVAPFAVEPAFEQWWTAIRISEQAGLRTRPGTAFHYSNVGYALLAEVVRRVTGQPFDHVLSERITEPLGMNQTAIKPDGPALSREVPGHLWVGPFGLRQSRRLLPYWMPHDARWDFSGDGAISSTPRDVVRFINGLRQGRILSEASRQVILTPALENYAGGWIVAEDTAWHNGALAPLGAYGYARWETSGVEAVVLLAGVDVTSVEPELRVVVDAAMADEEPPRVQPQLALPGWIALASALYVPWWLGLLPIGAFLYATRGERSKAGVITGAMLTLGLAVSVLAFVGTQGVVLAVIATFAVGQIRYLSARAERTRFWWVGASGAAAVLIVGLAWAFLVQLAYGVMEDPWELFQLLANPDGQNA